MTCKQWFNFFFLPLPPPLISGSSNAAEQALSSLVPESLTTVNKYSSDSIEITSQNLQLDLNSLTAAPHLSRCPAVFNWPSKRTSSLHLDYVEQEVRGEERRRGMKNRPPPRTGREGKGKCFEITFFVKIFNTSKWNCAMVCPKGMNVLCMLIKFENGPW